jgi:hypothetical protein
MRRRSLGNENFQNLYAWNVKLGIWKTFGSWRGNHLPTCSGFGEHAKHLLFSICNDPYTSLDLIVDSKVNGYIENFECFYFHPFW